MSKTAVVYTCAHADPEVSNERFTWLGEMIYDIKPDYVIDLGDGADMKSLNSYDTKYPTAIASQNYEKDVNVHGTGSNNRVIGTQYNTQTRFSRKESYIPSSGDKRRILL